VFFEERMPFHFANVVLFSATAILFVFGSLLAGTSSAPALHPRKVDDLRMRREAIGQAWFNFIRFYLIALVFVIFEVEIAFMFRRVGLQVLHREGPGAARVRRDLRVRGDPRRWPRLRLAMGDLEW